MNLFDSLPERIFQPLAAPNRRFYAALLMHLQDQTFGTIGSTPRKPEVVAEIGDFIEQWTLSGQDWTADPDQVPSGARLRALEREAAGQDIRRYMAFSYLEKTGWLIEMRDRFRKLVDLSPAGRMLLHEIQRIAKGDTRSYGGAVLNVLGNLEAAADHPDERSEGIRNAWTFARDFTQHLRTVAGTMRQLEDEILSKPDLGQLFRAFFEELVTRHLIADYKTLFTRNNPFRFRHAIMDRARAMEGDALLMARLSAAYVREGRAPNAAAAEDVLRRELYEVQQVFEATERQLDVIAQTQERIGKRIATIVRYMDRDTGGAVQRMTEAMARLAAAAVDMAADVPIDHRLLLVEPVLGGQDLYVPRPPKADIKRTRARRVPLDPALQRYQEEKARYAALVLVSPQKMRTFAERVLGDKPALRASEVVILDVEDFVAFQRLREIALMFDGYLARQYRVTPLDEWVENDWMIFQDFTLARTGDGAKTGNADDAA